MNRWIIAGGATAFAVIAGAGSCGSSTTATSSADTSPSTTGMTPAEYKAAAQAVTVSQLANDPNNYNGETVTFTAQIANFLQDSAGDTTAMNVIDPSDPTSLVYVQLGTFAVVTQMNKSDTVVIWGDGQGLMSGKNAYGATIHESAVNETYLSDSTSGYQDNTDPAPS